MLPLGPPPPVMGDPWPHVFLEENSPTSRKCSDWLKFREGEQLTPAPP